MDHILKYMEKHQVPLNRQNYVAINWMGDADPSKPLPAELEASLPKEFQIRNEREEQ